jgi:hypothetical protein
MVQVGLYNLVHEVSLEWIHENYLIFIYYSNVLKYISNNKWFGPRFVTKEGRDVEWWDDCEKTNSISRIYCSIIHKYKSIGQSKNI